MFAALAYVGRWAAYRVAEFFRRWYAKGTKRYFDFVLDFLARLDYVLAWRITARHLFEPLYRDYTVMGYALGFAFRSIRLAAATAIYAALFVVIIAGFIAWIATPPLLIFTTLIPWLR